MRNRNAVKRALTGCAVAVLMLTACGPNSGAPSSQANPIQPAMANENAPNTFDFSTNAALSDLRFTVNADWVLVDTASTGVGTIKLNSSANAPQAANGGAFFPGPIKDIYVSAPLQSGRFIRILYGNGAPPLSGTTTQNNLGINIGQNVYDNQVAAASATVTIVTAAQNVRGIIVRSSSLMLSVGVVSPTIDQARLEFSDPTDTLFFPVMAVASTGINIAFDRIQQGFAIPPGRELRFRYFSSNVNNTIAISAQYDVL